MPRRRGRGGEEALNPWPGFVDALSTLLMVIIFVLLVFVLAQAFLSVALTGRDRALDRLNRQVAELSDMLSLERGRAGELQLSVAGLNRDLATATQAREAQTRDLAALRDQEARTAGERDTLRADRDRLAAQLADAGAQARAAQARTEQLQARLTELASRVDSAGQDAAGLAGQLADTRRQLAQSQAVAAQQLAQLAQLQATGTQTQARLSETEAALARQQTLVAEQLALLAAAREQLALARAELARTVSADRATIEAKLADLARLQEQLTALAALRDDLQRQVREALTRTAADAQRTEAQDAQVALLNQQMAQLRLQMAQVAAALDLAETAARDKDTQITNLGSRLNAALASKVEELQRYRSEFFGRLRDVLANRPGIQVVGDRFVFQSEVLFPAGSADLTPAGQDQIRQLAATLKTLIRDIPPDVNWLLRVDGHADRQKQSGAAFASNWELSSQRAINVVKLLVLEGVPAERLAATGFGEFQPLDPSDTPAAFAKNRRIEIRLTDR